MVHHLQNQSQLATAGRCNFASLNLDSEMLVDRIEQALSPSYNLAATLGFYGVPGSGMTCLACHLADTQRRLMSHE